MSRRKIDVDSLTPGEMATIILRYDGLLEAQEAAFATLIDKLTAAPGFTDAHAEILVDWGAFNRCLLEHFGYEIEKTLAGGVH